MTRETSPTTPRLTAEREREIRECQDRGWNCTRSYVEFAANSLLTELDAVRAERDEAQRLQIDAQENAALILMAKMKITDEMVERAAGEIWRDCDCCTVAGSKIIARRALTAALGGGA